MIKKLREKNKKTFGLKMNYVKSLKLPMAKTKEWLKVLTPNQILAPKSGFSVIEKIHYLTILETALEKKLRKLKMLKEKTELYRKCNIAIILNKIPADPIASSIKEFTYSYHDEIQIQEEQ
jgi:hypothetical protein